MASTSEWTKHKLNERDILVPPKGTYLKLPPNQKDILVPPELSRITVIYATILSLRKPLDSKVSGSKRQYVLEPFHVGCFVKCFHEKYSDYYSFTREGCVQEFFEILSKIGETLSEKLPKLNKNGIPVLIHEFSKYASHFILKNLRKDDKLSEVIKKPEDKYYSFTLKIDGKHRFRFFDPNTFLRQPLDESMEEDKDWEQSEDLAQESEDQEHLDEPMEANEDQQQLDELMEEIEDQQPFDKMMESFVDRQHLVQYLAKNDQQQEFVGRVSAIPFPFDSMTSLDKLREVLPNSFEDKLSSKERDSELDKAQEAWHVFGCENLEMYAEIHAKFQVLSLCDIFEKLRDLCKEKYKLEMLDFKTPATLTWEAMLSHVVDQVEYLSDIEMIRFFKNNIRGGISQCCKRHAKANNVFLNPGKDPKDPSKFIIYLDINNASGNAMSQYLPISDYSWIEEHDFNDKKAILEIKADGDYGYIMEVDLHYPHHYGTTHRDLPYCSEKKLRAGKLRLITNMYCKKNYVIHYRNLQQCLENGLELKKVHKVLKFRQAPWLKKYIEYNTELRRNAKNDLEKRFYKCMNNALSGMTQQRIEEHFDLNVKNYGHQHGELNTENCALINKHRYLRRSEKTDIKYTQLVHVGFCIHEFIKLRMYDFHYNHMLRRYSKDKLKLLYMETDSLIYEIETENFYEDLKNSADLLNEFDTSGLNDRWEIPLRNKITPGKFKDEKKGKLIEEFYSTGSKTFYYRCEREENEAEKVKRAAGVPRYHIDRSIHEEDYRKCVLLNQKVKTQFWTVKEDGTDLTMTRYERVAFSPGDIKRKVIKQIETEPLGYNSKCCCDKKRKRSNED